MWKLRRKIVEETKELSNQLFYTSQSHDLCIVVRPMYLPEDSMDGLHQWIHHVSINNVSKGTVKVIKQSWSMIDGYGVEYPIIAAGQDLSENLTLRPDEGFEFIQPTVLASPNAVISGFVNYEDAQGIAQVAEIPTMLLMEEDSPHYLQ
jgi:uncharacterized protein affecting Mg2+/Co2+ transport